MSTDIPISDFSAPSTYVDTLTGSGCGFGQLDIAHRGNGPDPHMPTAAKVPNSTDSKVFTKAVASNGDLLTYTISIINGQIASTIDLNDVISAEVGAGNRDRSGD